MRPGAFSYVSGPSERPLLGLTLGQAFDRTVDEHPDQLALVSRHQRLRYDYRDLRLAVDRAARGFMALGVAKGDRVGMWAPNCADR